MATAVIMPRQGQSVESCLIGKWYKNKGDKVSVGDILFTYETDKATFEEESKVDGVMLDIFFEEGDDVECLVNVCVIGAEGESADEFRPTDSNTGAQDLSQRDGSSVIPTSQGDGSPDLSSTSGDDIISQRDSPSIIPISQGDGPSVTPGISPRARKLAEKTFADLRYAVPTGANGRIIERDVQTVLSQGHRVKPGTQRDAFISQRDCPSVITQENRLPASQEYEIVALSNVRKFIAKVMHDSLANAAQLTSHSSFDAADIMEYRKKLKSMEEKPELGKITITDIIVYAVSRVLLRHKSMNAHFLGDKMALFKNANIGVAVDTPRGLLVPTIFNANLMTLSELSAHTKVLIEKCKQGSIEPDLLKGASFTISNLGGLGVEMFTPILNPPQTGILGVCNTIERTKHGKFYPALGLSITYDHQAMDGADSARFLKDLVDYLEDFSSHFMLDGGL